MSPEFTPDFYFGSVSEKRVEAHRLFTLYETLLLCDEELQKYLHSLTNLSNILSSQMASMGTNELCYKCGSKPGGGCCSSFMAGETDTILLLINLLMDVDVTPQRDDNIECCYLGKQGCILKVKPIFCLNYNCWKILDGNSDASLALLDKAAGNVLRKQVEIEEIILKKLSF